MAATQVRGACVRKDVGVQIPPWAQHASDTITPSRAPTLRSGSVTLTLCNGGTAYCGSIQTPLDPAGQVPGLITTSFEFYPHRNAGTATGTIVAEEGGPGYSTTGTRSYYLGLYLPLMDQRDLLLVDKRGTGRAFFQGVLDCVSDVLVRVLGHFYSLCQAADYHQCPGK